MLRRNHNLSEALEVEGLRLGHEASTIDVQRPVMKRAAGRPGSENKDVLRIHGANSR